MSSASPAPIIIDPERAAESNTAVFLTVVCGVWSLAFVTALVRFYTRAVLVRSFGKDDVFMVFAVLCGIGGLVTWILECKYGFGKHQNTIPPSNWVKLLEAQFFQSVIEASFAFGFLKISIALSLLRLRRGDWYSKVLWALIAFTCFYTLFAFATFLTFCKPIAGQWNPSLRPKCYSRVLYRDFGLFNAACNIFTDITFATLPIPLIWSLQLQRRIRIYLVVILSGGYCAVALGIAKAVFVVAYVHETDGTFYPFAPFFGSLQLDIGIIAACAPTLRPLLGRVLRLSTSVDPYQGVNYYRGANYYRAAKALDRLPITGTPEQELLQQGGSSGQYIELVRRQKQWEETDNGDSTFLATAVHAEHVQGKEDVRGEKCSSDEDAILPLDDPAFKDIVKTMELKVEK